MPDPTAPVDTAKEPTTPNGVAPIEAAKPTETPVTPVVPAAVDTPPPTESEETVEELKRKLKEAEDRQNSTAKEARKAKDQRRNVQREAGQFESLYQESLTEIDAMTAERDALIAAKEATAAELKATRRELEGYRKSLLELFQEEDREDAGFFPTDRLPAHYEKQYGAPMFPSVQPPPSVGVNKTTPRAATSSLEGDFSVSDYLNKKYSR